MPITFRILPARTAPGDVQDALHNMTDGSFEVVAVEVFDHPEAEHVINGAQFGGDRGPTKLGAWVLGRRDAVYDHLQHKGYTRYEEQYSEGIDADEEDDFDPAAPAHPDDVPYYYDRPEVRDPSLGRD